MKYTINEITINFLPWFDKGYKLKVLKLYEEICGKIAYGSIVMELEGTKASLNLVTNQFTGKLKIEKDVGDSYEIDVFITNRQYYKNSLTLEFLCLKDRSFYTDLVSLEHSDITTALNSLYPGKIDIRCESDLNNSIPIIQNCETNYDFCNELAFSFRKNVIFGYSWDRFFIKEKIGKYDSKGNLEPKLILLGNAGTEVLEIYSMHYNSMLFEKPWDPWLDTTEDNSVNSYADKVPINNRTIKLFNNYITVGSSYVDLIKNYLYNTEQAKYNMFVSLKIKSSNIPDYRLGDVIIFKEMKDLGIPNKYYLVKSNELVIINEGPADEYGSKISLVSTLIGLEHGTNLLPETDPLNEMSEDGLIP